ncbi:M14 family metallocarboxypeptidase [Tenacibaculum sp. IB213877]|uniref:M14 family metallopeptidase n=1 Tax=Tenacibaculum sp. IB213877 TaxID=3097351 RepID=UPI002A5B033A|nr:M14 family zinc carboxypeptidase [Tenacibaculum sp. IB213877]MDY0781429.1 M14 family zinc carboxypeptidase [Tenacibaculum sp. IB213877]
MNKKYTIVIVFLLTLTSSFGQLSPQSKKITKRFFPDADSLENVTPALMKDKGFTDYREVLLFFYDLESKHPNYVSMSYIGKSQEGFRIPMFSVTNTNSNEEKIKVWMQGGLHGNEPASTEGLLYLVYQLINNPKYNYLLDKIDLAIVPMANIDGYLNQSRYASNGLDLNRDQTKLMAPESVALKQAYSDFNPEVAVDFHEYNPYRRDFAKLGTFGIAALYDIMFLYSGNLNVPENMRQMTDTLFVENARKVLTKNNLRYQSYMSTGNYHGEIHFKKGANNARSSATSYALTNAISSLIEVRGVKLGRTSFKRRVATTYLIGMSYLETAYKNMGRVKEEIAKAQKFTEDVTVTSIHKVYKDTIEVIDLDTDNLMNMEITVRDGLLSSPILTRKRPKAYFIKNSHRDLIKKLIVLGVETDILEQDTQFTVEAYIITKYDKNEKLYEKVNRQKVKAKLVKKTITFPEGTFVVTTNQKNAPMITEVLEPEAPNSFVSFGVLETELNNELPIYRLPKKN